MMLEQRDVRRDPRLDVRYHEGAERDQRQAQQPAVLGDVIGHGKVAGHRSEQLVDVAGGMVGVVHALRGLPQGRHIQRRDDGTDRQPQEAHRPLQTPTDSEDQERHQDDREDEVEGRSPIHGSDQAAEKATPTVPATVRASTGRDSSSRGAGRRIHASSKPSEPAPTTAASQTSLSRTSNTGSMFRLRRSVLPVAVA